MTNQQQQTALPDLDRPSEAWAPIWNYEGVYAVSSHGRVMSLARTIERGDGVQMRIRERILRPGSLKGYEQVHLRNPAKGLEEVPLVHRLVAQHFIPNPDNLPDVTHLDGNRCNNHVGNLAWATKEIDVETLMEIRRRASIGETQTALGEEFGIPQATVSRIIRGKLWRDGLVDVGSAPNARLNPRKLDLETARAIRLRVRNAILLQVRNGLTNRSLAKDFGVSEATISNVVKGKTWLAP